jgi:hypothetical protein
MLSSHLSRDAWEVVVVVGRKAATGRCMAALDAENSTVLFKAVVLTSE